MLLHPRSELKPEEFTDLQIEFRNEEPFCRHEVYDFRQETVMAGHYAEIPMTRFYVRLGIRNIGRSVGKECECRLIGFREFNSVENRIKFESVLLGWADLNKSSIDINESETRYLNLIYSDSEQSDVLHLDLGERDSRGIPHSVPRRDYSLEVSLTGKNVEPRSKSFRLKILGDRYDQMELKEQVFISK